MAVDSAFKSEGVKNMAIDPATAGVIASGVINGAATIGSGIVGLVNNSYNKKQNEWNKQFAREQFDYQKYVTENAAQIRARDLEAAGLSKTLAAGDSASSIAGVQPAANSNTKLNNFEKQIINNELASQLSQIKATNSIESLNRKQEEGIQSANELNSAKTITEAALANMYNEQANLYKEEAISQQDYRNNLRSLTRLNETARDLNISKKEQQDFDNFLNKVYNSRSTDHNNSVYNAVKSFVSETTYHISRVPSWLMNLLKDEGVATTEETAKKFLDYAKEYGAIY